MAAVIAVGIGLSAILAAHFSDAQIEERRYQLMVEVTGFAGDLEQYLQSREMAAKVVGTVFEAPAISEPHPLASVGKKLLALTPEIGVIAWIPQVDPSRPNFETLDVTDTHRVLPVVDIEAKADDRKAGLGLDVGLFPSRKAVFE